jgi:MFS family permease
VAALLGALIVVTVAPLSAMAALLPELQRDLALDTIGSAWLLAAYALTFAVATALFGRLTDAIGLRRTAWIALSLLSLGSLVAATAPGYGILMVGRFLQGLGGGGGPVLTVGIVTAALAGAGRRRAFGIMTGVAGGIVGAGPLLGAIVGHATSWRLLLALPVASILLAPAIAALAPSRERARVSLDLPGVLLVVVAVAGTTLLAQSAGLRLGRGGTASLVASVAGAAVLLVPHVRARPDGFLPHAVVRNTALLRVAFAAFTLQTANLAGLFALPKLLDTVHGYSAPEIGLVLLPAGLAAAAASPCVARWVRPSGARATMTAGPALSAAGLVVAGLGWRHPGMLAAGFMLVMTGFGVSQVLLLDRVPKLTGGSARGMAMGVFNLIYFYGAAVGPAVVAGLEAPLGLPAALTAIAIVPALGALAANVDARP